MADSNQYDIVFILDESGSMGEYIGKVRDNISSFVEQLRATGIDVQLGIVEYGDNTDNTLSIKKHELTDDVNKFVSDLTSISVRNGSGENGLTAIMDPTNGALSMNFREGSNKEFIVVTDEGYFENDSSFPKSKFRTYTEAEVVTELNNKNVKLDVFGALQNSYTSTGKALNDYYNAQYRGEGWCQDEWTPIANATTGQLINGETSNGQFYDIESDFSSLLNAAIVTGDPISTTNGTHQFSFAQWNYGFTPADATASLASSSVVGSMATSST